VPAHDATLHAEPVDPEGLSYLTERWGLTSSVDRLLKALRKNSA
jgi:hypothetical protein